MNQEKKFGICIPIEYRPWGGMYSFIHNFKNYLKAQGFTFTKNPYDEYDVLFVNSFMVPYSLIKRVKTKRPSTIVVQRIDGSARDYGRYGDADTLQARVNTLTDLTIFQSQYGRYATMEKYLVISQDGPVIHNPVNINIFCPEGQRLSLSDHVKICHVTYSTNPKKGIQELYAVARENPDIDFILCGQYDNVLPLKNIHILGVLKQTDLAKVYRSCDVFITFSENEACPNVVLEAMASGLPILYKNSGGTPELVGDCGLPIEVQTFRQQLEKILTQREELSIVARKRAENQFAPDVIFPQYIDAIKSAQHRPIPSMWTVLKIWKQGYPVFENPWRKLSRLLKSIIKRHVKPKS